MKKALAALWGPLLVVFVIVAFGRQDRLIAKNLLESILQGAVPLLLCGLAVAIGFRAGVFNLGAEGQLIVGAVAATAVGVHGRGPLLLALELVAGATAGAAWSGIAAWLKRARGAPEVLTTILLNFVAAQLARSLLDYHNPLNEATATYLKSDPIATDGVLEPLVLGTVEVPKGLLAACALALALEWALFRTRPGFEIRLAGTSPTVARAQGFSPARATWTAFLSGGALAGLAGALGVVEITQRLYWTTGRGAGFTAVAVALVAGLRPAATAVAALAFAAIETGAQEAHRHGVPHQAALALEGVAVLLVVAWEPLRARLARPAAKEAAA